MEINNSLSDCTISGMDIDGCHAWNNGKCMNGFLCSRKWIAKSGKVYHVKYCSYCGVKIIGCESCNNNSCSGGGCDVCTSDFKEWLS